MTGSTRRGFLGLFGGAVVGGKRFAKEAITKTLSPMGDIVVGAGPRPGGSYGDPDGSYAGSFIENPEALRLIGLPDWLIDSWREESKYPYRLDPDLASYRSFSLAAKLYIQRDRDFERCKEGFWERGARRKAHKMWTKLYGQIGWW